MTRVLGLVHFICPDSFGKLSPPPMRERPFGSIG
jgi:hypothetical protein